MCLQWLMFVFTGEYLLVVKPSILYFNKDHVPWHILPSKTTCLQVTLVILNLLFGIRSRHCEVDCLEYIITNGTFICTVAPKLLAIFF